MATPYPAAPGYPPQQQPQGNGMAVAGLVLGILGLVLCWIPFVGAVCGLVGIILAALGIGKAKRIGGAGKGMAIAGLVCGILGIVIGVIFVVMAMIAVKGFDDYMQKSKKSEAELNLRRIEKNIKVLYMTESKLVGSSRVDLQACKLEYSIVSPK